MALVGNSKGNASKLEVEILTNIDRINTKNLNSLIDSLKASELNGKSLTRVINTLKAQMTGLSLDKIATDKKGVSEYITKLEKITRLIKEQASAYKSSVGDDPTAIQQKTLDNYDKTYTNIKKILKDFRSYQKSLDTSREKEMALALNNELKKYITLYSEAAKANKQYLDYILHKILSRCKWP